MKFSLSTCEALQHYVYALVDPRDHKIFYVGKASGNNRAFQHLHAAPSNDNKSYRIQEIRTAGYEPYVDILRSGLKSEEQAHMVEATVIDAIGLENLTNEVRGHGIINGRLNAYVAEHLYGSKPINIEELSDSYMMFYIHKTYSPTVSRQNIYDLTRQYWYGVSLATRTPDPETGELPYPVALAIVDGVVVEVYSISNWFPANTTFTTRIYCTDESRWEFIGQVIEDHDLRGKRLFKNGKPIQANQKGFGYIN